MFEHFTAPHLLTGLPPETPILVAFSGGSDSVALLAALRDYAGKYGTPLRLAHVNHGIRGEEALRDRDFCVAAAAQYGLPISVLDADVPALREANGGSMEEVAREVRYDFFARVMAEYHIPLLATAHHADDQLETLLLRLARGTGPDGLCGIPPLRAMGEGRLVIRPLLTCEKATLEAYCRAHELPFVVDSTNEDIAYARNRIRQRVIPELRAINAAVADAATRLSETMRVDVSFLTEQTDAFVREAVTVLPQANGSACVSAPLASLLAQPSSLRRRALVRMMRYAGCPQAEERFVTALERMTEGALSLPGGVTARCERGVLRLSRESDSVPIPTAPLCVDLSRLPQTVMLGDFGLTFDIASEMPMPSDLPFEEQVCRMPLRAALHLNTISRRIVLRTRRSGDVIRLRGHHRRLKKLFCDLGVPLAMRDRLPLLCDEQGIVWIPGIGLRDGMAPKSGEPALCVSVKYLPTSENVSAKRAD